MAAGCPVVGANKGGIPDIITDGINGCLYDPDGDNNGTESLILATEKLLGDKSERQEMRNAARAEAERWGWPAATEQLRKFYQQILNKSVGKIAA